MKPGDDDGHVSTSLDATVSQARRQGVRWIIATPHFWRERGAGRDEARVQAIADFHRDLRGRNRAAADAGDEGAPLLIPGIEETRRDPGHMGLSFFDIERAWEARARHGGSLALAAEAQGGLVVLNHPFGKFGADLTWKPWTAATRDDEARALTERAHAIEAYNRMMAMGETVLARSPERRQTALAFGRIEREALESGRRIVALGGSDNHNVFFHPTTWAYVRGPLTERSLHEALAAGRVVCGENPDASSFEAATDRAPAYVPLGSVVAADREVRLRWRGKAELFRDGVSLGAREGPFTDAIEPGSRHVYRLVVGRKSFANPVFVNLGPGASAAGRGVPAGAGPAPVPPQAF